MQGSTATTRHGVTKRKRKKDKNTSRIAVSKKPKTKGVY